MRKKYLPVSINPVLVFIIDPINVLNRKSQIHKPFVLIVKREGYLKNKNSSDLITETADGCQRRGKRSRPE